MYIFYPKNGKKEMKMQFHVDSNSYATYDDNVEVMPKFCITACANMNGLDENFCKRTCDFSDSLGLFPNCDYITIAEAIELVKQGNDINDVFDCVIPCKNSPVLELNGRIYYMRSDGGIIGKKELFNTLEEKVSNNPRFVDLGLSVKWCNFNFGGDSPEEGGAYLAWGETDEKEEYNGKTYDFGKPFEDVGLKYGIGRVPTTEEFKELCELESFWGICHDISGMYFIGGNGNAIFLPAAGLHTEKNGVRYPQTYGNYWSSDAYSTQGAKCFLFSYNEINPEMRSYRNLGFSVRLVQG